MTSHARVTDAPLDIAAHLAAVASARHGASALFLGIVRDHDPSVVGEVTALEYLAHPDAEDVMRRVLATDVPPSGLVAAASHRTGLLHVGDIALVVAVGAPHRAEAFAVCERIVESIKREVPVWKREHLLDGSSHWVGIS